jgi:hypothetical protein
MAETIFDAVAGSVNEKITDILHITPITAGSGNRTISGFTTGDIVIFTRNCSGMLTVSSNGNLATVITISGVSNQSFSNNVLTFTLTSAYSCDFTVLHRGKITIS